MVEDIVTYTLLHFHQNYHTYTYTHTDTETHTHTHTRTLVLVVSLPGSLNSSMRALFTKVNSPSDSPPCFVCVGLRVSWCTPLCESQTCVRIPCVCMCPLHLLCGPSWGWELFCMWLSLTNELFSPSLTPKGRFSTNRSFIALWFGSTQFHLNLKVWVNLYWCVLLCSDVTDVMINGGRFGWISHWIRFLVHNTTCNAYLGFIRLQYIYVQVKMFSIMHTI